MARSKKTDNPDNNNRHPDMPDFESMSADELERQTTILRLRKEWLVVEKEAFTRLERERELCTISTAIAEFGKFLHPVRDFLIGLPDFIQDIVPEMTPEQYQKIQDMVADQTERLAQNQVHLTIHSNREEKELSTDITRAKRRRANIINGLARDSK